MTGQLRPYDVTPVEARSLFADDAHIDTLKVYMVDLQAQVVVLAHSKDQAASWAIRAVEQGGVEISVDDVGLVSPADVLNPYGWAVDTTVFHPKDSLFELRLDVAMEAFNEPLNASNPPTESVNPQ